MATSSDIDVEVVADRLHSASIHLLRRVREEDAQLGVAPARLSALSVLVFRGPLTIGELAEAEGVRSPTMTRIVSGLETADLIRRQPHNDDGRAVLVAATTRGRRLIEQGQRRRIRRLTAALGELNADELAAVARAANLIEELFGFSSRPWAVLRRRQRRGE